MNPDKLLNESYFIKKGLLQEIRKDMPPYAKEYSGLILCTNGNVVLNIENELTNISKNDLIGIKPFISIKEVEISLDCEVIIIGIHNNLSPQITETIKTFEPLQILNLNYFSKITLTEIQLVNILDSIQLFTQKINEKNTIFKHHKTNAAFSILLYEIIELFISNKHNFATEINRAKIITSDFIILLNTNTNQKKGVEYFAEKLNITPKHLISSVKTITKETPRKIIDKMILNEAKKTLQKNELTIQEISDLLGFSDASSFTKFFKRNQGETPKSYKRKSNHKVN